MRVAAFCAVARRNAERWCGVVLHFNDLLRGAFVATVVCCCEGANNGEGVGTCVKAGDGVHLHGDVRIGASVCGCRVVVHNFLVAFDGEACWNGQLRSGVVHEQHALLVLGHVAAFIDCRVESEVASSGLHTSSTEFVVHPRQGHVAADVFHRDVGRVHVEFGAFKLQLEVPFKAGRGGVFNDEVARERGAVATCVGGGEDHGAASGGRAGGHKFAFLVAPDGHAAHVRSGGAGVVVQPSLVFRQVARPVAFHRRVHANFDDRGSGVDDLNGLGLWARAVAAVVRSGERAGDGVLVLAVAGNGVRDFGDRRDAAGLVHFWQFQGMICVALCGVVGGERHKLDERQEVDCDGLHADGGVVASVGRCERPCHHVLAIKLGGVGLGDEGHVSAIVKRFGVFHGVLCTTFCRVALRNNQGWRLFVRHNDDLLRGGLVVAIVRRRPGAVQHELVVAERIHGIHSQRDGDIVVRFVDGGRVFQHNLGGAVVEGVQWDIVEDWWRDVFQSDDDLTCSDVPASVCEGVRPNERGRFLVEVGVRLQGATS